MKPSAAGPGDLGEGIVLDRAVADELRLDAELGRLAHDQPAFRVIRVGHRHRRIGRADAGDLRAEVAPALLDHLLGEDRAAELLELLDEDRAQRFAVGRVLVDDRRGLVAELLDDVLGDLLFLVVRQRIVGEHGRAALADLRRDRADADHRRAGLARERELRNDHAGHGRDDRRHLLDVDQPAEFRDAVARRVLAVAVDQLDRAPVDAAGRVDLLLGQQRAAVEIGAVVGGRSGHRQDDADAIGLALRRLRRRGCRCDVRARRQAASARQSASPFSCHASFLLSGCRLR